MWYLLGPPLCALMFALVQLAVYAVAKRLGWSGETPFFGLLLFRGLILTVALAAGLSVYLYYSGNGTVDW